MLTVRVKLTRGRQPAGGRDPTQTRFPFQYRAKSINPAFSRPTTHFMHVVVCARCAHCTLLLLRAAYCNLSRCK